ncbi:MAG: tetratricopeptide repeat protein, partial [Desulfomonilaceae bacterium]
LYSFNKKVSNSIINALSPASAEILRQGLEFVHKSDDYKAMVRFEDIRSLEKRNKNYLAVGWALLEIGRIYIRRGDYLKAEESIDNSLKSFFSLKAVDEQILALIELAKLKQLEKSAEQSKALFTQAQELANTSGHSSLIQSIQDFASGPVKQQQRATAKVNINQAKIQKDKNLDSNPTLEPRPKPEPPTNQVVTTITTQSSKAPTLHVDLGKIKSVFDMKPETFRERKIAFESKPLVSPNNVVSIPKNYVITNHSERKNENKNSVATPTAAVHPDAMKPLAVKEEKQLSAEPVISKNQDNSSIDKEITELRKLRKQKDEAKMVPILENLSRSFYEIGDYKKALNAVNVALAFREKLGINDGRAKILELRGLVYEKLGEKVEALENLTWAGSISKTLNESDKTKTTDLAQNLGLDVGSALNNYRALWSARESGNTQNEIKSLLELGNLYAKIHNFEEASKYYELSNASLMAERSIFYKKLGKLARARKTFEEALQTLKSLDYLLYFSFINRSEYHDKISAVLQ